MTTPKLVQAPPQGCGLTSGLVDGHYEDLVRGRPGQLIAARVLIQPVGTSQRRTKEGIHKTVTYEVVRLEPVRDPHAADSVTWEISHDYETRTGRGGEQLSLINSPAEQRLSLVEAIREHVETTGLDMTAVDEQFHEYFGGTEYNAAATVEKGALLPLLEFARFIGAIEDPKADNTSKETAPAPAFSDSNEPDDDEDLDGGAE